MAKKGEIIYGTGSESDYIFFPINDGTAYAEMKIGEKDKKYSPTGVVLSPEELNKRIDKNSKKKVKPSAVKKNKSGYSVDAVFAQVVKSIKKSTASLPNDKEIKNMLDSVKRQAIIGDQIIPGITKSLEKISTSIIAADKSISDMEIGISMYSDPLYFKKKLLRFDVAVAKKNSELAKLENMRNSLDVSSSRYASDSANLDLKEAIAMSKFASTVSNITDPLLNLRRNVTTRMDAIASTIKSIVGSVSTVAELKIPRVNFKSLKNLNRIINRTYSETFKLIQGVNSKMSIEVLKAKLGWRDDGSEKYVTVTKYDDSGKPYKVYLTKKEMDKKTGLMTDVRIENPDYTEPRFEAEDAMLMVGSFISKIVDTSNSINSLGKYKIISPIKTSIKLRILAKEINMLVNATAKSFSNIDYLELKATLETLVGSETTSQTLHTNQDAEGVIDQVNTMITSKNPGILGSLETLISTIKYITSIDVGNSAIRALKTSVKLSFAGISIRRLARTIIGTFPASTETDPRNGIDYKSVYLGAHDMFLAISYVRDKFEELNEDIEALSESLVSRKTLRVARRNVRRSIRRYSRLFDTIISEINRKEILEKREDCKDAIYDMTEEINSLVKMVDGIGALKGVSRNSVRSNVLIKMLKTTIFEVIDLMSYLSKNIDEDSIKSKDAIDAVSGVIPIIITDMIHVVTNVRKLKPIDVAKSVDVIRSYSAIAIPVLELLKMYSGSDRKSVSNGTAAMKEFSKSIPDFIKICESMSDYLSDYDIDISEKDFVSSLRMIDMISDTVIKLSMVGRDVKEKHIRRGIRRIKSIIELFDTFNENTVKSVKNGSRVFNAKNGIIPLLNSIETASRLMDEISVKAGFRTKKRRISKLMDNIHSIVIKIYNNFGIPAGQKILKDSKKSIMQINIILVGLSAVQKNMLKLGVLAPVAAVSSKFIVWMLIGFKGKGGVKNVLDSLILVSGSYFELKKATKKQDIKKILLDTALIVSCMVPLELAIIAAGALALAAGPLVRVVSWMLVGVKNMLGDLIKVYKKYLKLKEWEEKSEHGGIKKALLDIALIVSCMVPLELALIAAGILAIFAGPGALLIEKVLLKPLVKLLSGLPRVLKSYDKIDNKAKRKLLEISLLIAEIGLIELSLIATGILALPALVGTVAVAILLLALKAIFLEIHWLFGKTKDIKKSVFALGLMCLGLLALTLTLMEIAKVQASWNILKVVGIMALTILVMAGVFWVVSKFTLNIVLGSIAVAAMSLALLVTAEALGEMTKYIKDFDWSALYKLPLLILAMAVPFAVIGIPIVAGLVALGSIVMLLVAYSYKKVIEALTEFSKVDVSNAEKTIDDASGVIDKMVKSVGKMGLFDWIGAKLALSNVNGTIEVYSDMIGLIERISNLRVVDEWNSDGTPKSYKTADANVFSTAMSTIDRITEVMKHIYEKTKEISGVDTSSKKTIFGKAKAAVGGIIENGISLVSGGMSMGIISHTVRPMEEILDFIVNLTSKQYKTPDGKKTLMEIIDNDGGRAEKVVESAMTLVSQIAGKVKTLDTEDGNTGKDVRQTRRGKRRLKIIADTIEPINDILKFVREICGDGDTDEENKSDGVGITVDLRKSNKSNKNETLSEFIARVGGEDGPAVTTIDNLFGIMKSISNKVKELGKGGNGSARRGRRRLNIIEDTIDPIKSIMKFFTKFDTESKMFDKVNGNKSKIVYATGEIVTSFDKLFEMEILTCKDTEFNSKKDRLATLDLRIKEFTKTKNTKDFKSAVESTSDMVESINAIDSSKIDKLNRLMKNMTEFGKTVDEALKDTFDKITELAEELHYIIEAKENSGKTSQVSGSGSAAKETGSKEAKPILQTGTTPVQTSATANVDMSTVEDYLLQIRNLVDEMKKSIRY